MPGVRHWIGVASREHVRAAQAGGFIQLCHGKAAPLRRLQLRDYIVYYSPSTQMRGGEPVQAFTAIGVVGEGDPYPVDIGGGFVPFRRPVAFFAASEAPIRSLLPRLSFTRDRASWGYAFRRGVFEITLEDFTLIARAMAVTDGATPTTQSDAAPVSGPLSARVRFTDTPELPRLHRNRAGQHGNVVQAAGRCRASSSRMCRARFVTAAFVVWRGR